MCLEALSEIVLSYPPSQYLRKVICVTKGEENLKPNGADYLSTVNVEGEQNSLVQIHFRSLDHAKMTAMNETQIRSVSLGKGFGQSNAQTKVTKFHAYTLAPVLVGLPTSSVTLAQIEVLKIWLERRGLPS